MDYFDSAAHDRIDRRGISLDQITLCVEQPEDSYPHRREMVFIRKQSNGRLLKVAVRDHKIANAFVV